LKGRNLKPADSPRNLEKEQEKVRLQSIVTDFKRAATTGLAVELIDEETLKISQQIFCLDKLLYKMTLRPLEEDTVSSHVFDMKNFEQICKGPEAVSKSPKLKSSAARCLRVSFTARSEGETNEHLFFYFPNESERDKFYTCLKILHMSSTILRRELQR